MPTKKKTLAKKNFSAKKKVAVGLGIAAAGLAAYLLSGSRGKKRRAALKKWAGVVEKEIAREVKKLKTVSKKEYDAIVSTVAKKYSDLDKEDLKQIVADAKRHFADVRKAVAPVAKKATKSVSKIVRKGSSTLRKL